MKYSDKQRLEKIYNYAAQLQNYLESNNVQREDLLDNISLQWLVATPLYNIGEQAYNLSKEYKQAHGEIQWGMISGLRHRLVHDYDGINWDLIANILFEELPVLIEQLKKIL